MASVIKLKRSENSGSVPTTVDLQIGEVAINTADKKIFARDSNGNIIEIANVSTGTGGGDDSFINAIIFG